MKQKIIPKNLRPSLIINGNHLILIRIGIDFQKFEFFRFFRNRIRLTIFRKRNFDSKFLRIICFQPEKKNHFPNQNLVSKQNFKINRNKQIYFEKTFYFEINYFLRKKYN